MNRLVQPEWLDTLAPDDPRAIASRRDLCRVNGWMGNHRILRRALRTHLPGQTPGRLLEIGAGDGKFLLQVLKGFAPPWPRPQAILLDRQKSVPPDVLDTFSQQGWQAEPLVTDVFDCPPLTGPVAAVVANLFLHHFADDPLARLLGKVSEQTDLFIAVEPWRFAQPWLCGQLLRLIGCNAVTLHDAEMSIRAGFQYGELSALWPDKTHWQLTERRAGFFSYLFIARRVNSREPSI
jgi:hypothetical protein